jgi:hypothetical protein
MRFGYVAFLDRTRKDLQLFEIDKFGQVVDENPLYGQEDYFKGLLPDNKSMQIVEILTEESNEGLVYMTRPIAKVFIADKWRDVEHIMHGSSFELLNEMFDDFYSGYVDMVRDNARDEYVE